MRRVIAVIVLVCMVGVAIGYIKYRGFNRINSKTGIVCKLRKSFCIKKKIMVKAYTKDLGGYRNFCGTDNMFTYSLFKVKRLIDNKFGFGVEKVVRQN